MAFEWPLAGNGVDVEHGRGEGELVVPPRRQVETIEVADVGNRAADYREIAGPAGVPDRQTEGSPRRRAVGIDLVVTGCVAELVGDGAGMGESGEDGRPIGSRVGAQRRHNCIVYYQRPHCNTYTAPRCAAVK